MNSLQLVLKYLLSIVMFLLSFFDHAQTEAETIKILDGSILEVSKLNNDIRQLMEANSIPAISMAIINDNKVVYNSAVGVENIEKGGIVDKQSIFEAASLSKPIFAYFVMKMVEEGTIDLDKPLYTYLEHPGIAEESKDEYKLITARMVLSHQTGLPNHANNEPIKLAFKPGTDFSYSGEAYQYLAYIIGYLNGGGVKDKLNAIFENKVTKPLGMEHSSFLWNDYLGEHKVFGHQDSKPTKNDHGAWSGKTFNSYSSLQTNATEYSKFLIAMLKREGLSDDSFDEMLKEETHFKDDNPLNQQVGQTGWGLGFAQKITENGTMHMHTGNNHDFQSYAMFMPEQKYGIVIFANCDNMESFLTQLSDKIGPQF